MRRKYLIIFCVLIVGIGVYNYISTLPMYKSATKHDNYLVNTIHDDTIRIAYIGDSWAFLHSKHKCIIDSLIIDKLGLQTQVRSAGVSGMTSKEIYESLFVNDSIRNIIKWGPRYCFVVAGINDTDLKLGRSFYCENISLIIDFLMDNNITPIILEIPHFDIQKSFQRRYKKQQLLRLVSMIITFSKVDCIDSYRYSFEIGMSKFQGRIIYIKEQEWNPGGYKDSRGLYQQDMMHLNDKGYAILDSCIALHVCADILKSI